MYFLLLLIILIMATEQIPIAKPKTIRQLEAELKRQQKLLDKATNNIPLLNKLLNTNKKLYNERGDITDKCKLVKLLILLIKENYNFTSEQVDKFFEQAFYTPGYYSNFITTKNTEHKNIISYMLNKGKINNTQILSILNINQNNNDYHYIYDILFQQKYDFTIEQYKLLKKALYVNVPINNYDTLHNNVVYSACSYIENNTNIEQFNKCVELLQENKMNFNIEHLNIITIVQTYFSKPLVTILNALLLNFDDNILNIIISNNNLYNNYILYILIEKYGCNDTLINYLFDKNNKIYSNTEILLKLMLKGYKCTLPILNKILKFRFKETFEIGKNNGYETLNLSLAILEKQYNETKDGFTIPFINLFEIFDIQPDLDTLNIVCRTSYKNEFDLLLNKYKLIPDYNTLKSCFVTLNYDVIRTILNYKITPSSDILLQLTPTQIKYNSGNVQRIIDLLIEFGLMIKINSIEYLLLNKFCLENLERFDIKYEEELYFLCYLANYWPTEYANKFTIDKVILNMHELCRNRQTTYIDLITYLNKNSVRLDRYSIDILLHENNYLFKVVYDKYQCIPSILTTYKKCEIPLRPIAELYNITSKDMFEQYKMV